MEIREMRNSLVEAILCNSNLECGDGDTALFDGVEKIEPFEDGVRVTFKDNKLTLKIMEG